MKPLITRAINLLTEEQQSIISSINPSLCVLLENELIINSNFITEAEEINSDDENTPDEDAEQQAREDGEEIQPEEGEGGEIPQEEMPSLEEIRAMEIAGTEQKFTQGVLYDSLGEMGSKIELLLDIIYNNNYSDKDEYIRELENYQQYIGVLNELIFSLSVDTTYKLISQIKLNLIELLEQFKEENQQKFEEVDDKENINNINI